MKGQIFLGGACGNTTWRRDIAVPALEAAGITYFNPQLGIGEWSAEREAIDMKAKDEADVLLFVINDKTRGIASIAEVAYLIGTRRPIALVINDINDDSIIDGDVVSQKEKDDLNRGRLFIRTMAEQHCIPVYEDVESAIRYSIDLVKESHTRLSLGEVQKIISDVSFKQHRFMIEPVEDGFHLQLRCEEEDVNTGERCLQEGRKWHICRNATKSEIIQTTFKAIVTWQEHDARERFRYCGEPVFSPHSDVDSLLELRRTNHSEQSAQKKS